MLREIKDDEQHDQGQDGLGVDDGFPLAFNLQGDPIEVPEEAVGWRVRRLKAGDKGGAPELVYDNGRPLILPLEATAEELIERVAGRPGRYRLDPVDSSGKPVRGGVPAYSLVEATALPSVERHRPDEVTTRLLVTVEQLVRSQQEGMAALTGQMAQVINAMGNAVVPPDKRRPVEYVQLPAPPQQQGGFDWEAFMASMAPSLQGLVMTLVQRMMAQPAQAAPAQGQGG
jgi:hypothetical protein